MTREQSSPISIASGDSSATVQLLVADSGNRTAIGGMLDDHFDVETSQTVTDADLYLVEDHLFREHRSALRERVEREYPAFCPVVLIRRERTNVPSGGGEPGTPEESLRIDEVVDAPIDPPQLVRRLNSLLVRRTQSRELMDQLTTLEQREQRLRRFEHGIEATGNGIVMTDSTGTIEYVNPALEAMSGYTEADTIGESPQKLLPEGTGDVFDEEFWRTMADQEEWEGDIVIERKNSQRRVVNATATALRDPGSKTEGFVIVLNDITGRIQREQELEDREEELDLLRQILTRYLRHNFRNDLNVIQGSAQLLKEDETLSPAQVEWAETIIENADDLIEKSETARTYSSLLERDAELTPFDLSDIATTAVRNVRKRFPDVDFEIDVPETCDMRAREGIQQAVEELIDNAARHNDAADPWVRIRVRDRESARLVIEDNGPGISDQERDALERGSETQLSHSQGVGLWLSKMVIEGIDGRLSVEEIDSGARVTADFPPAPTVGSTGLEVTTLKERERRLQTITDRMTDAIIEVNADWNVVALDGPAEEMLDVDADSVVGYSLWDAFSDLRDTRFETVVRNAMESRSSASVEQYFERIDAWLEVNVYPEFDGGLSFYTRDITKRKERERDIQRLKERFELAVEGAELGVWDWDMTTDEVELNEQYVEMLDYTKEEFGHHADAWKNRIHPDDREQAKDVIDAHIAGETEYFEFTYRMQTAEGDWKWLQSLGQIVERDDEGAPLRSVGVQFDITDQKEREEALKETKQRLETIIELSPEPIVAADSTGTVVLWNEAAEDVLGYESEEAIGERMQTLELFTEEQPSRFKERFERVISGETIRGLEVERRRKDGTTVNLSISATPLEVAADEETGMLAVAQDITSLKERERELTERVKELSAIHTATNLFQTVDSPMEELLSKFIETIPQSFQYPGITEARLKYNGIDVSTDDFDATEHMLTATADLNGGSELELDVGYLPDPRVDDERPFLAEERALLTTLLRVVKNNLLRRIHLVELERTEDLLTNAETLGDVGAWEVDLDTKDAFWTAGTRRIFGVSDDFDPTPEATEEFFHPEDSADVVEAIKTCAESGDSFSLEARLQTANGEDRWVHIEGEPLESGEGTKRVRGYVQDITERRQRNRRYEAIFNQTFQFTGLLEPDGTIIEANDTALEFGGIRRTDVVGKKLWNSTWFEISKEIQEQAKTDVRRAAAGEFVRHELEIQGENSTVMVDFSIRPVTDDDGSVVLLVPEARDIMELKRRERELSELKERYKALVELAPDPVFVADAETGEIVETNAAAETLMGKSRDEIVGRHQRTLHPPEDAELYRDAFETHAGDKTVRRLEDGSRPELMTADGDTIPIEISASTVSLIDGPVKFGIFRDISEQVEREREIQHEQARFKAIFENSFDAMVIADDEGRYIDANESAEEMFGLPEDELIGRSIAEFAPEDFDFAAAWEAFQESEDERGTFPLVRADGEKRDVEFAATRNIVPGQHLSILRDVTEKKDEERRREQIIDRVTDAIVEVDSDWRFTLVNEEAEALYGMDEGELLGRDFWDVFEAARDTVFEEEYRHVMESREPTSFVEYFSQLDGWFDIKAYPKEDGGLEFYFVEVTEQIEVQRDGE